jgi:hypothetical protein
MISDVEDLAKTLQACEFESPSMDVQDKLPSELYNKFDRTKDKP